MTSGPVEIKEGRLDLPINVDKNQFDPLVYIPTELALRILNLLDPSSLHRATQVSKVWHNLASDPQLAVNKKVFGFFRMLYSRAQNFDFQSTDPFPCLFVLNPDCAALVTSSTMYLGKKNREAWGFTPFDRRKAKLTFKEDHILYQAPNKCPLVTFGDHEQKLHFSHNRNRVLDGGYVRSDLYTTMNEEGAIHVWDFKRGYEFHVREDRPFLNLERGFINYENGRWLVCQNMSLGPVKAYVWTLIEINPDNVNLSDVTQLNDEATQDRMYLSGNFLLRISLESLSAFSLSSKEIVWQFQADVQSERVIGDILADENWVLVEEKHQEVLNHIRYLVLDKATGAQYMEISGPMLEPFFDDGALQPIDLNDEVAVANIDELGCQVKKFDKGYLFLMGSGKLLVIHLATKTVLPLIRANQIYGSNESLVIQDAAFVEKVPFTDSYFLLLLTKEKKTDEMDIDNEQLEHVLVECRFPISLRTNVTEEPTLVIS